jgi:hypothetical protein
MLRIRNRMLYQVCCLFSNKDYASQLNSSDLPSAVFSSVDRWLVDWTSTLVTQLLCPLISLHNERPLVPIPPYITIRPTSPQSDSSNRNLRTFHAVVTRGPLNMASLNTETKKILAHKLADFVVPH